MYIVQWGKITQCEHIWAFPLVKLWCESAMKMPKVVFGLFGLQLTTSVELETSYKISRSTTAVTSLFYSLVNIRQHSYTVLTENSKYRGE